MKNYILRGRDYNCAVTILQKGNQMNYNYVFYNNLVNLALCNTNHCFNKYFMTFLFSEKF